jgi:anti-sigma factor RsiW
MDCSMERLVDYSAGRLAPAETAALEAHLAVCPECRRVAAGQSAAWKALDAWEAPAVSPGFDARLWARIEAGEQRGWRSRLAELLGWRPALAAVLAGGLILVAVAVERPRPAVHQMQAESIDVERVETALEDIEMLRQLALAPVEPKAM